MGCERLLDLLVEHSYTYSDHPEFKLASGRFSHFYIDCKATTMRREAARSIAEAFDPFIPKTARAIGGLTMGADPIAYAIRDFSPHELDAFCVRKEAKAHGLKKSVEGPVSKGLPVVVVDDVITAGGSTITALRECRRAGLEVVAVIVMVDREEDGGMERVRTEAGDIPVTAVFKRSQLHARWMELKGHGLAHSRGSRSAAG
jgi:orotate phosphoribosyltransferase